MRRVIPLLILLVAVVVAPMWLRRDTSLAEAGKADDRLVIVTPHNETIRREFGEAFAAYWKEKTGRSLSIDWRIPGGTSDIRRVLDSLFAAADENGQAGVGMDVFFGGGEPDFQYHATRGRLVALEVFEKHAEWFREEVIPERFTGERYYDPGHLWVGTCLSQMGICYNVDSIQRLGVVPPKRWEDLGHPAYAGYVALADPTKSSSVGRAFEMMIQEQMQRAIVEMGDTAEAREEGWKRGLNLLQRMTANARYFTDSANKVPHDVMQGDAAAGTCIDFYGRSFEEKLEKKGGRSRLKWMAPEGGTSISVDPVAVFRGAPRGDIAQEFVAFLLSDRGQLLWNVKVGHPNGAKELSPRRLPVRKDLYRPELLVHFADADALPYERSGGFEYRPELTGPAFTTITAIVRAMAIDPHEEMKESWRWMRAGVGPAVRLEDSEAAKVFFDVSHLSYHRVMTELVPLVGKKDPLATGRVMAGISAKFRENYEKAMKLAQQGGRR